MGGGLVKQDDAPPGNNRTCERYPLCLAPGDAEALLAELSVEPARHAANLVGDTGAFERGPHVGLGGVGAGDTQVVGDGAGEQPGGLRHACRRLPQRDLPASGNKVATHEGQEGGFALAAPPDDPHPLAGGDGEVDVGEHIPVVVAERQVGDGYRGLLVGVDGNIPAARLAATTEEAENATLGAQPAHAHIEEGTHLVHGLQKQNAQPHDGDGLAGGEGGAVQHQVGGGGDHGQVEGGIHDKQDELVTLEEPHDGLPVAFPGGGQLVGDSAGGTQ